MVDTLRYIYLKDTSKIYWFWSLLEFERQLIFSSNWCQSMIDLYRLILKDISLRYFGFDVYRNLRGNWYFPQTDASPWLILPSKAFNLVQPPFLYLPASSTSKIFTFIVIFIFIFIFICLLHLHQESLPLALSLSLSLFACVTCIKNLDKIFPLLYKALADMKDVLKSMVSLSNKSASMNLNVWCTFHPMTIHFEEMRK